MNEQSSLHSLCASQTVGESWDGIDGRMGGTVESEDRGTKRSRSSHDISRGRSADNSTTQTDTNIQGDVFQQAEGQVPTTMPYSQIESCQRGYKENAFSVPRPVGRIALNQSQQPASPDSAQQTLQMSLNDQGRAMTGQGELNTDVPDSQSSSARGADCMQQYAQAHIGGQGGTLPYAFPQAGGQIESCHKGMRRYMTALG
ncbi:uncharacterized protein BDZ99DRAFT_523125 [Mytilinidion resinicola]|uniref:Uncharacterized protein n=1 Tax=Mytilinidion resinicola TaxID=574789 RepID=A0A6A6YG52_9PEZI|nr:uncharacterized protein BDZ99DRAFT_523125 [Mytilinidion resinicola]KAF2807513.1 hypothetical protein BDZ99DRAFT_523125 [Mytilinidion resinicola]